MVLDIEAMRRSAEAPVLAGPADIPGVIQDLTDAFAVDPHFNWFLRDDERRTEARRRIFQFLIGGAGRTHGRIERPAGGGAAAVWMPFEWLAPTPFLQELRTLPIMLFATGLARFSRLAAIRESMDKHHPMDRPPAYLWFLGVTPAAQGHGVGSRLLKVGTDRLDAAGQPAYLETGTER